MPKSFSTLINEIEQELQDTGNAIWSAAELAIQLEDAIREASDALPHVMEYVYLIESRTGVATTDTANALVDATESQFVSTDADKVIYNTENNTWAIVTAYVSATQLTLSKDIMVDGNERYEMYNKGCRNRFQINIEDIADWVGPEEHGVLRVEYPKGTERNFEIHGDILTLDVRSVPDSKVRDPATDVEIHIWVEARQRVLAFADLAGTVNGTPSAGDTTFTIAAVGSGTDVITEDALFTIANVRGTYKIKSDLTLSGGGGAIIFYPGLESAPANGAIVAFVGSTLNRELERLVVELTAAKAALSKTINATTTGGMATVRDYRDQLAIVLNKIERMKNRREPRTSETFPKDGVYNVTVSR